MLDQGHNNDLENVILNLEVYLGLKIENFNNFDSVNNFYDKKNKICKEKIPNSLINEIVKDYIYIKTGKFLMYQF